MTGESTPFERHGLNGKQISLQRHSQVKQEEAAYQIGKEHSYWSPERRKSGDGTSWPEGVIKIETKSINEDKVYSQLDRFSLVSSVKDKDLSDEF